MSLVGVDVGTTGCKAVLFTEAGEPLCSAYREYDIRVPHLGWAELDTVHVWDMVKRTIKEAASAAGSDPVKALAVSSLGEAMVPVTNDREILGPSLLNFDVRGEEYVDRLGEGVSPERLYEISGNTLGNHYSLPKLMWIREHQPELFDRADRFLLWGGFIPFMLGAEAAVDYSLANRTLLFDLKTASWSEEMLKLSGIDGQKLPRAVPSGTVIGTVSSRMARELGLGPDVKVVSGAHDQCSNAVGCGVVREGAAMYGMGTYICIVPVYTERKHTRSMLPRGLNTEHHAVPGKYVSFIYNQGGVLFKWYRDTFAAEERRRAADTGENIYPKLIAEMPEDPSSVFVLPYYTATGPPDFVSDGSGLIAGLKLETQRGDILKAILEGVTYYLRECLEALPETGIAIEDFRAVGGGANSDEWVQLSADIFNRPFLRPRITEAGSLGAALMAGAGCGVFASLEEAAEAMVSFDREFTPNQQRTEQYSRSFQQYKKMWPLMGPFLRNLAR